MSKKIKQLEMDSLKQTFQQVRDLVVLSVTGLDCQADHRFRQELRKKKVRLQVVKNSLARRVFDDLGIKLGSWQGPTVISWGGDSIADLSKAIDEGMKKYPKVTVKTAVAEGLECTFKTALAMPTRTEAIGQILSLILGPGAQIAGQIIGPAAQIAGQVQTISEKKPEEEAAAPAPASA